MLNLNLDGMGLMDFFRKGREKPVESKPSPPHAEKRNTPASGSPEQKSTPQKRDYVIQSGDSLSKIARQFYGNANDWQKIYQANRDQIKDPNLIYPGQKIVIP